MVVNFGKATKGGSFLNFSGGDIYGCKFTSNEATTLSGICIYCKYVTSDAKIKAAIYDSSYNLVTNGTTDEVTITSGQDGWVHLKFSTKPSVSASTVYWLVWRQDQTISQYYDGGSTDQYMSTDPIAYTDPWPDPFSIIQQDDFDNSLYGAGTPVPSVSDTVTVTDTVTDIIRGNARDISVNDSVTVSESKILSRPSLFVQEYVNVILVNKVNVDDSVSISESITPCLINLINVSDSISIAEDITSRLFLFPNVQDSVSVAESISAFIPFLMIDISDAVSVSEYIKKLLASYLSVSDAVSVSERYRAIFGWITSAPTATTWTDVSPSATSWTDVSPVTATWTDVDKPDKWYT